MGKKSLFGLALATTAVVLSACGNEDNHYYSIATASTGGTYYPIGVGMGNLWTEELIDQGIRATGQSSAGSVENIDLLRKEEAQFGILQGLIADQAYRGTGIYEGSAYEDLRTVTMLWSNVEHFVLMNNKIESGTISDVEGTSFSIGPQASGTEQSTRALINGIGLSVEDVSPDYLGYDDTISSMRDGRLDGGSLPAGVPVTAITDMYASGVRATVLDVTDEQLDSINELYPVFFRYEIDAGTYPRQEEPIYTIAQSNVLGVDKQQDADRIYLLTKILFENLETMYEVHNSAREMTLETALVGVSVPLHLGAYRYFVEQGIDIPNELIPPEAEEDEQE
ncbi:MULTISPECIES: TAXI family TRAP transporter solute-binding subunit [Bacillaceae]|uniref:C4-dicarboxylate ABC transporter substrate-binding protein n=1 Tax=Alkalicoccobacillus plakortidis TaxID=444060 RepID=A0A9D5I2L3_9BACI|nr:MULTISPECIES: TAXI family TRAP transporter solute-binding subunit [Bacillaceae]KQL57908.1 C4-dicarboxylate ABC transporter substrate-binding protein [Alkalicoccobacillus plakortidis]